jgi:hypothetical protein
MRLAKPAPAFSAFLLSSALLSSGCSTTNSCFSSTWGQAEKPMAVTKTSTVPSSVSPPASVAANSFDPGVTTAGATMTTHPSQTPTQTQAQPPSILNSRPANPSVAAPPMGEGNLFQ